MGEFLATHFASGWRKLGTFSIVTGFTPNGNCPTSDKVGGNVVAYFCTPELQILTAVWGPESPQQFLAQARWAVELAERLRSTSPKERVQVAREVHETNPYRRSKGMVGSIGIEHVARHDAVTTRILSSLNASAAELFLKLVNERASEEEIRICDGGPLSQRRVGYLPRVRN